MRCLNALLQQQTNSVVGVGAVCGCDVAAGLEKAGESFDVEGRRGK